MNKAGFRLTVLVLFVLMAGLAITSNASAKLLDGHWWKSMDTLSETQAKLLKLTYVRGYCDGSLQGMIFVRNVGKDFCPDCKALKLKISSLYKIWGGLADKVTVIKELDVFYDNPKNIYIPVIVALKMMIKKVAGNYKGNELQVRIDNARRDWSNKK